MLLVAAVAGGLAASAGSAHAVGGRVLGHFMKGEPPTRTQLFGQGGGSGTPESTHAPGRLQAFYGQATSPQSTSVTWPGATPSGWYTNTYHHAWYYPWYAYYNFSHGPYASWPLGGGFATYGNFGPAGHFDWPGRVPAEPYIPPEYRDRVEEKIREQYGDRDPFRYPYRYHHGDQFRPYPGSPGTVPVKEPVPVPVPDKIPDKMPEKKSDSGGRVSVTLPSDAKLLFNGALASGTGSVRTFDTPPLQPGQSYTYELTAEVTRDGRPERVTSSVVVRAGETTTVTLMPLGVTPAGK
jgi:uncharacterized protein (TIGR03000 family)